MFMSAPVVRLRLSAPRALFTDPKFRQNRITYPYPVFPTILGAVAAIYWKPEALYEIQSIGIIKAGQQLSLTFNHTAQPPRLPKQKALISADFSTDRRNTILLEDVDYLVSVRVDSVKNDPADAIKHAEILRRRATKGQCFKQPFMGARELPLTFELADGYDQPLDPSLDIDFVVLPDGFDYGSNRANPFTEDVQQPLFAPFQIKNGLMTKVTV